MPVETKTHKLGNVSRDRDFERLLQAASRRLSLHQLKSKKLGRQNLKSFFFAAHG